MKTSTADITVGEDGARRKVNCPPPKPYACYDMEGLHPKVSRIVHIGILVDGKQGALHPDQCASYADSEY
jgi:hypothetical protein